MKFEQIFALVTFFSAGVTASPSPGRDDRQCKKYEWDLKTCRDCKYKSPRDLTELEARGRDDYGYDYGRTCKKACPEKHKQCSKWGWDYSKPTLSGYFDEYVKCPRGDSYKVNGKISTWGDKQYLVVEYKDWDRYNDKKAYLGVYLEEKYGPSNKYKLNANKYCKGNTCKVPVSDLYGFPKELCKIGKLYVGIDDDQCKRKWGYGKRDEGDDNRRGGRDDGDDDENKGRGNGRDDDDENRGDRDTGRHDDNKYEDKVKYVRVHVTCKGNKKCEEYCCCG